MLRKGICLPAAFLIQKIIYFWEKGLIFAPGIAVVFPHPPRINPPIDFPKGKIKRESTNAHRAGLWEEDSQVNPPSVSMDNPSIITQVTNPKEEEILSCAQDKGENLLIHSLL